MLAMQFAAPEHAAQSARRSSALPAQQRSGPKKCFVDFLRISQRSDKAEQLFEARAVGVNVRHRSVQDHRVDIKVRIEWRGLDLFSRLLGWRPIGLMSAASGFM
jgi:hypothetical protein